jgi:predicted RNase H-related nuclease YkuK (DUF458 family)
MSRLRRAHGRGGRAVYTRKISPRINSLRQRLVREVWLSVDLGLRLISCGGTNHELTEPA